jgi:DNA-binding beta-propeller fold protein YncE
MSLRRYVPAGGPRVLVVLGLALAAATCRDAFSPRNPIRGPVAVAPILPSEDGLAAFGLVIDAVRVVVVRPAADTLADTTVALPPGAAEFALDLRVPLLASAETLSVSVIALSGTIPLFTGTALVPVPSLLPPTEIQVDTYIGPTADSIAIQPRTPFIGVNDSLRFQVQGFTGDVPVTQFYVAWTTSDTTIARINAFGVLRAPASRASVRVRARTPSGASDSVSAMFVPPATQLIAIAGGEQTDTVGSPLTTPLEVEARAADGLGVGGVSVWFRPLVGGGAVADAVVVTDGAGRARTIVTLGAAAGAQTFEASAVGLGGGPVTFTATAIPDAPVRLVKQSVDPQSGTVATAVTGPVVKVTDQFGNGVSGVIVDFVAGGGGVVGAAKDTSNDLGLATASSWTLGSAVGSNTVAATAGALPAVVFTATGFAGPPVRLAFLTEPTRSLAGDTIAPAVQVEIQDQFGNRVLPAKDSVTLGLRPGSNPSAKLLGSFDAAAVNGVATFANLAIDSAGVGDTLVATSGTLAGARSKGFDIGGVIKSIPVTLLGPVAAALNVQTKKIYVPGATLVSVLLDDKELLPQIQGLEAPFGVAANATTSQIYVSSLAGLVVIDGSMTPDVIRLTIPVGTGAKGVAVDEQANFIYVAASDPQKGGPALVPVDGSKDAVVLGDVVALPDSGMGVAFNPNDGFVYVVIPSRQSLVVIDPRPGNARIVAEIAGMGKGTYGVAIDVRTNVAYVTNRDERSVSVVDLVERTEQRLSVGDGPEGLGVDSDRGVVYVANSLAGTLSLIDASKFSVFATLVVGQTPKAAVVDPATGRVYVPSQLDDLVRVVQP